MRKNLHIYPSPFEFETRILKETKSLIKLNLVDDIVIVSQWKNNQKLEEEIDKKRLVKRFKLGSYSFGKGIFAKALQYTEFIVVVFWKYKRVQFDFVNCHSLLVLPIGVLLKKFGQTRVLIYDPHELETERVGLSNFSKKYLRILEGYLLRFVDRTIVVCEPIKEWYVAQFSLEYIFVVQNMPYRYTVSHKSTYFKDKFLIPRDEILFIYQGILSKDRGIIFLIDAFSSVGSNKHIVFMGYGILEDYIVEISKKHSNIHFHPAVPQDEIVKHSNSADIGVNFIEVFRGLSYRYSLPNKYGEYMISGLPMLVSHETDYLKRILVDNNCGWSIPPDMNSLLGFIENISMKNIEEKERAVQEYSKKIGWEFEEQEYLKVYKC